MTWYILSMLWALFALGLFLYVSNHPRKFDAVSSPVLLLVLAGLVMRLVPALLLVPDSNFDIDSYWLVSQHVVAFEDVYTATDTVTRHPYLPFQLYWMGFSRLAANQANPAFIKIVRLAPIAADILISLVIFVTMRKHAKGIGPFWAGLLYAVNPISIYVSAYHGQFDAIPILFILLAILAANQQAPGASGVWLGLGILSKSWPVLALPSILMAIKGTKQKILFLVFSGLVPLVGVLVYSGLYDARILTVLKRAISYNHGMGVWGYTYLLRLVGLIWNDAAPIVTSYFSVSKYVTVLALGLVWLLFARKQELFVGLLTILVSLLAFFHAFSIQYLVWLLPFAILDRQERWLKRYTLAAFSYMFLAYHTLILRNTISQLLPTRTADLYIIIPAGLAAWLVTLAWAWSRFRAVRERSAPAATPSSLGETSKP